MSSAPIRDRLHQTAGTIRTLAGAATPAVVFADGEDEFEAPEGRIVTAEHERYGFIQRVGGNIHGVRDAGGVGEGDAAAAGGHGFIVGVKARRRHESESLLGTSAHLT